MFASLAACAAFEPRPRIDPRVAAGVEVSKNNPPPECGYLGPVKGSAWMGDLSEAQGDAMRNAVMGGGNYVAVDVIERPMIAGVGGYGVRGRLFVCPKRDTEPEAQAKAQDPEAAAAAAALKDEEEIVIPQAICEPSCSPGFTCSHGVCVTACNPECGAGARCGDDKVCHVEP